MRIVLLNQYYAPDEAATAQILSDLGEGLAALGHDVRAVCCSRAYADPSIRYPSRERVGRVEVRRSRSTGFGRGSMLGRLSDYATFILGAAWQMIAQPRPDVIVSLSTPPMVAALGLIAARLRGARSIYWVMDVYPDVAFRLDALRPDSMPGRLFAALSRWLLRRSDRVVALGETMAERLREHGAEGVVPIHNWADPDGIRPRPIEGNPLRAEWEWGDRFVVLYSGNMGLAHEFDTVLEAAARLRDRPEIRFAFIGGGPRRAEVEAECRRRELDNVEFRPYVPREQLGESLTAGDVHVVTLREGMQGLLVPSKIYGILAAGRPTLYVGPDEGEIADILRDGECGSRVALGDAQALVDAIRAYAERGPLLEVEGRRARAWFEERFTTDHGVEAFRRLIEADPE